MSVTLAQIAALAGVSRGTVDRALNNRGRVDPQVAARIKRIAEEQGYRPNRAGRLLALVKNPLRIGILMQSAETAFMQAVLEETERARPRFRAEGAELMIRTMESIDVARQLELIDELLEEGIDGLAITPAEDDRICERIDRVAEQIPVVTFNTDMPASKRMCYVGQDNYASGRACAGLMGIALGGKGKVLMVTGHLSNLSHRRRVDGFRAELAAEYPGITMLPLERCGDNRRVAYEVVCAAIKAHPDLTGLYFAANGQSGACDAIRELGLRGKVHFICHDWSQENADNIRAGMIDFLIDQNMAAQGVRPTELLLDYLLVGNVPDSEQQLTTIDIRNKYNI